MGSTGLDFVCGRCWLPSPFSGYHVDGTDFLACGRCVELMLRLDKECKKTEQEAKTQASSEEETLAEIAVIEECRSTAPKMEAFLRAPGKLAYWQPHVRAVADAVKWAETLPEPDAIDKVLDEVGKVTSRLWHVFQFHVGSLRGLRRNVRPRNWEKSVAPRNGRVGRRSFSLGKNRARLRMHCHSRLAS